MEVLFMLYNVVLLTAYLLPITIAILFYKAGRLTSAYPYIILLFASYFFTDLLVYATEFSSSFATIANSTFMEVPTLRTLLFFGYMLGLVGILHKLLDMHFDQVMPFYVVLGVVLIVMISIPALPNSATKVFCYYTTVQLFTLWYALCGMRHLRAREGEFGPVITQQFRLFLLVTAVFSVLIALEDAVVIYFFDDYSDLAVDIQNRSFTEDILSLCHASLMLWMLVPRVYEHIARHPEPAWEPKSFGEEAASPQPDSLSRFYLFSRQYQMTVREQEILQLMVDGSNNSEIADALSISLGTAKTHIHNIYAKANVTRRKDLLALYEEFAG